MLQCSNQIQSVRERVENKRRNTDFFDGVYDNAIKLGLEINVSESVPKQASRDS